MMGWNPSRFERFESGFPTSSGPALIVTDCGKAILKGLGNPLGPHALAKEWISIHLASWLGMRTFDAAILHVGANDEIPLGKGGGIVQAGPAFVTRYERGGPWGGTTKELRSLESPEDLARLVILDTWLLNPDRYPPDIATRRPNPDNVFLTSECEPPQSSALVAMDLTHAFGGDTELNRRVCRIEQVKNNRLHGIFPEFGPVLDRDHVRAALDRLKEFRTQDIAQVLRDLPKEWMVDKESSTAVAEFLERRAAFLTDGQDTFERFEAACWSQRRLEFGRGND